jgi:predicted KAP-like P-loop ATPase
MWSDNETTEDLLGFKVHADLITEVVKDDTLLPTTIGVFGDWGSGKSSVLKIASEQLDELDDGTFVLYFNGWLFEGYDDAKAALLESIIKEFEKNQKFGANVKGKAKKLLKSVNWMRAIGLGFKKVALPVASAYLTGGVSLIPYLAEQFGSLNADDIVEKLQGEESEEFLKSLLKDKEAEDKSMLVREFRDEFAKLIDESKIKKLVVVIDDLDRCTPDRIIENLEAIKLFLNVEKTAFIIGADPRIVRHAIEYRFKPNHDGGDNDRIVDDYLEKLIQVPYYLPKLSDSEVETYISLLIAKRDLKGESFQNVLDVFCSYRESNRYSVFGLSNLKECLAAEEYEKLSLGLSSIPALAPIITQSLYGNPRQIKRFLNTFTLRKRLADIAKISGFNDAVLAKLMILEYSELPLFKQLYDWQISQEGIPGQLKELEEFCEDGSCTEKKDRLEKKYSNWTREKLIKWLTVDPKLKEVDLRDYFWISRDRISSSILGASLVPPIVKQLFNKLNQDGLPAKASKHIISAEVKILGESELSQFLIFISSMLKKNKNQKRLYDIFHYLIEEGIEAESYYKEALVNISNNGVEPAIGNALKRINVSKSFRQFLNDFFKDNKSPASKAYNLK